MSAPAPAPSRAWRGSHRNRRRRADPWHSPRLSAGQDSQPGTRRAPPWFPPKKDALSAPGEPAVTLQLDNVERKLSAQEAGMCLMSGVSTLATQYASRPLGLSSV